MALYALALGYSNGIAPLIMGFINDGMGYQWVFVSTTLPSTGCLVPPGPIRARTAGD
jgi:hypothetical protein